MILQSETWPELRSRLSHALTSVSSDIAAQPSEFAHSINRAVPAMATRPCLKRRH
jgi:hypothetical protein